MPDIYKNSKFLENQDAVLIPDFQTSPPPSEEPQDPPPQDDYVVTEEDDDSVYAEEEEEEAQEVQEVQEPLCYTEEDFQTAVSAASEKIRAELKQQAYRDIIASEGNRIRESLAKVDDLLAQLEDEHEAFMNSYRDNLAQTAIAIAEKVVLHQISEDDTCLEQLVLQNVNAAKKEEWISVKVSEELRDLVQALTKEFKKPEYANVTLEPGAYSEGTCMVESPNGVVDASVQEQIKNISADLQRVR